MKGKKYLFILLLAVSLIYIPSIFSGFVWMDHSQVVEEGLIIHDLKELSNTFFAPLMSKHGYYYRPLFRLTLTLDLLIFGKNPFGYHLTNILFHVFNSLWIFLILNRFASKENAFWTSLFWSVHPLGIFVVSHISAMSDLLFSFFLLLSFYSYILFRESDKRRHVILSLSSFTFSLMSKEAAVVYPIIILIYEILFPGRKKWAPLFIFLFIGLLFFFVRTGITGRIGTRIPLFYGEPLTVFFTMTVVLLDYLKTIVFPIGLAMNDAFLKYDSFHPLIFISMLTFGLLFFIAIKNIKRNRPLLFFLLWFFILLTSTSNIIPAMHFRAERFLYLPFLGIIFFLMNMPWTFKKKVPVETPTAGKHGPMTWHLFDRHTLKIGIFIILIMPLGFITVARQFDFKDDVTLSKRVIDMTPHSKEAFQMLGFHYFQTGEYHKAIPYLNKALEINGRYYAFIYTYGVYNNLGVIYLRLNQIPLAIDYLNKALAESDEVIGHLNLYFCYKLSGRPDKAEEQLAIARTLDADLVKKYIK